MYSHLAHVGKHTLKADKQREDTYKQVAGIALVRIAVETWTLNLTAFKARNAHN